ncbi:MAG: hypothetical protein NUV67_04100 [archaeon]|nr:hypothetical protein [archaeon]
MPIPERRSAKKATISGLGIGRRLITGGTPAYNMQPLTTTFKLITSENMRREHSVSGPATRQDDLKRIHAKLQEHKLGLKRTKHPKTGKPIFTTSIRKLKNGPDLDSIQGRKQTYRALQSVEAKLKYEKT